MAAEPAPTDTAHEAWDEVWKTNDGSAEWGPPEPVVLAEATRLRLTGARTALDLGCGVGRHALALAALGFEVTAFDRSPTGLARASETARGRNLSLKTAQGRMTELPFTDNAFDYVLAWNVIYHGDARVVRRAVAEIARVLRAGGVFQGTMLSRRRRDHGLGDEVAPDTFVRPDAGGDKAHPHFFCDAATLVVLFEGFEIASLIDVDEPDVPGSWHWNVVAERR